MSAIRAATIASTRRHKRVLGVANASALFSTLTTSAYSRTTAQTATQTLTLKDDTDTALAGVAATAIAYRATVDLNQSIVGTDKTVPAADGVEVTTIFITLYSDIDDADGNPIPLVNFPASAITASVSGSGNTVTQPAVDTDENGSTTASYVSTVTGTKVVSIAVTTPYGVVNLVNSAVVTQGGTAIGGGLIFTDTFAGGVRTNDNGFTWAVTGARVSVQLAPDASGDYALRFRYGPDASGVDSSAEQRWNLGRDMTELWVEYQVWIPSNYQHRNDTGGDNNKMFRLWGDDYGSTLKVGCSMMPSASAGTTNDLSYLVAEYNKDPNPGMGQYGPEVPFGGAANLGAWNTVRLHYKIMTANGAADGVIEIWVNGTSVISSTINQLWDATRQYWNQGYFFGWSNSGYLAETDFFIRGGSNGPKFYDTDPEWT